MKKYWISYPSAAEGSTAQHSLRQPIPASTYCPVLLADKSGSAHYPLQGRSLLPVLSASGLKF